MHRPTFDQLGLIEPILKALQEEGYTHPTPIQAQSIPYLLGSRDLLGSAQTGTGKTAAFAIPILQLLKEKVEKQGGKRPIRSLILTPTRELAIQIDESLGSYGRYCGLRHAVIFGGVGQKAQTDALKRGIDILTATPGRLLDLIGQGYVDLRQVEMFVLDEADRMLDMGFIHDVKKVIAKLPVKRQNLLFSATMPDVIVNLSQNILHKPVRVSVTPVSSTAEKVGQSLYYVEKPEKADLLIHLLKDDAIKEVLVFSRTKHGANKLVKVLQRSGISTDAIHGNKSQNARQNALQGFKDGNIRVLVATDIAARGIDIDDLAHVVNYDLPNIPETYVHRIGRTGRAGASGKAISFCNTEERAYLRDIQRLIKQEIPVVAGHPFESSGNGTSAPSAGRRSEQQRRGPGKQRAQRSQGRSNAGANSARGEAPFERTGDQPNQRRRRKQRPQGRGSDRPAGNGAAPNKRSNAPEVNGNSAAKPDYAAMTRDLFGEVLPELKKGNEKKDQQKRAPRRPFRKGHR